MGATTFFVYSYFMSALHFVGALDLSFECPQFGFFFFVKSRGILSDGSMVSV